MKKIILNQKSYLLNDEMLDFIKKYESMRLPSNYDFVIFPPVIYLSYFKNKLYKVGSQNFFSYNLGSYTGEISLEQLKDLGIKYTFVSHPERKKLIKESYEISKEKMYKSIRSKFNTILFVGELKKVRNPFLYIKKELKYYLRDMENSNIKYLSICYEPSIILGDSNISINKINKVVNEIKRYIKDKYSYNVDVYYSGSIDSDNISSILDITDGVILGKECTNIKEFKNIISKFDKNIQKDM